MIHYIEFGDIFNLQDVHSYAHGCNCAGAMGKGIALQFRQRFPIMYEEYRRLCKEGIFSLGDLYTYTYEKGVVFNLGTQVSWKTKADLTAIESSLTKMLSYAHQNSIDKIALPKIGAGLGGLEWEDVKSVIERIPHTDIELYIVKNYKV